MSNKNETRYLNKGFDPEKLFKIRQAKQAAAGHQSINDEVTLAIGVQNHMDIVPFVRALIQKIIKSS